MKNITPKEFRSVCDEMGYSSRFDDNVIHIAFSATDDFPNPIVLHFAVSESVIQSWSCIPGFGKELSDDEAYEFVNQWNLEKNFPRVFLDKDRDFILDSSFWTDCEFSVEYFKENVIQVAIVCTAQFYKELGKRLRNED